MNCSTHVKTHKLLQVCKQVVANLFTSCRQVVFALLVPSCCNKFETSCSQLVTSLMALSDLLQVFSYKSDTVMINNKNVTRLTTQGCNNIVISWLDRTCWNNLATSLIISTRLLQVVNSLFQTCYNNWEQAVRTQLVDALQDARLYMHSCIYIPSFLHGGSWDLSAHENNLFVQLTSSYAGMREEWLKRGGPV
jgi:hypothetical protein